MVLTVDDICDVTDEHEKSETKELYEIPTSLDAAKNLKTVCLFIESVENFCQNIHLKVYKI